MKCKFKKIMSILLMFVLFFENVRVFALPPKNLVLSQKALAVLQKHFAEKAGADLRGTPIAFPEKPYSSATAYSPAGEKLGPPEEAATKKDHRQIAVYNIPFMAKVNDNQTVQSPFLNSILALYADSREEALKIEAMLEKRSYPDVSKKIQDEIVELSKTLHSRYTSRTDPKINKAVDDVANITHLSRDEALSSCLSAFVYKQLADKHGKEAVRQTCIRNSTAISSAVIGTAGLVTTATTAALAAAGKIAITASSLGGPIGAIFGGITFLATGICCGIASAVASSRASENRQAAITELRNLFLEERVQNGASLLNQLIGFFTNTSHRDAILRSNVLVTGIDGRNFPIINFKDVQRYSEVENHGADCEFMHLELCGSPTLQEYGEREFDYLFYAFSELSRNNISIDKIRKFKEGVPVQDIRRPIYTAVKDLLKLYGQNSSNVDEMSNEEALQLLSNMMNQNRALNTSNN